MGKNIIVLNGSPRPKGNTTALVQAFSEGAEKAGHTVTTFLLDGMNIHGCKGCFGGGKNPDSPCVQKDDMDLIYPVYRKADVVVMASPMYYWSVTGQLRTAFDRLFAVMEGGEGENSKKDGVLLMAAGGDEFDECLYYYNNLMAHLRWNNLGSVLAGGVNNIGDISDNPALKKAFDLGASIK